MENDHIYIANDLKSFYASVECVERQLDPMDANLVVADASRTEKTICLAVSPSLKSLGIPGRARLFKVVQKVRDINTLRKSRAPNHQFLGESYLAGELREHPEFSLSYIIAPPRMAHYMEYSTRIYGICLKYIAPEDIHVYSIDEVFMDVSAYLKTYALTARELAAKIIQDVLDRTGITATAGIGTNLYLCKVAMDIVAKHVEPDKNGLRIAELDEMKYRELLWDHQPVTDFWRVEHVHDAAIRETARLTGDRAELDETRKGELDLHLQLLRDQLVQRPQVSITYFVPDPRKNGGAYFTATGTIQKIEETHRQVIMENGTVIPVNDIYDIENTVLDTSES